MGNELQGITDEVNLRNKCLPEVGRYAIVGFQFFKGSIHHAIAI